MCQSLCLLYVLFFWLWMIYFKYFISFPASFWGSNHKCVQCMYFWMDNYSGMPQCLVLTATKSELCNYRLLPLILLYDVRFCTVKIE